MPEMAQRYVHFPLAQETGVALFCIDHPYGVDLSCRPSLLYTTDGNSVGGTVGRRKTS